MNITSKRNVKNLLKRYKIRPSKRLGQNFLVDKKAVKKIIQAANLKSNDIVLEIGPGLGTLTAELSKRVKTVIAVEKDPKMTVILQETLKGLGNIEIIQEDILKIFNFQSSARAKLGAGLVPISGARFSIFNHKYKVIGNLPFYLAAPLIRKFLESDCQPKEMTLIVQKEAGERIAARPPDMNLLAVSVQFYAKPEIISYLSKKSFWPQPKVNSAIIKIVPHLIENAYAFSIRNDLFFKIVKAGFSQPRKQLLNNLSRLRQDFPLRPSGFGGQVDGQTKKLNKEEIKSWLLKNKIQPSQRAETLEVRDWINLTKSFDILD